MKKTNTCMGAMLCVSIGMLVTTSATAQFHSFDWARQIEGLSWFEAQDVAADQAGNAFVVGVFTDSLKLDPGSSWGYTNGTGGFIQQYDASGNPVWSHAYLPEVSRSVILTSTATDANGDVYLTGYYSGTFDADPSASVVNLPSVAVSDVNGFVIKLAAPGNTLVWARVFEGSGGQSCLAEVIEVTSAGVVHVGGRFIGTVDFDPGTGTEIKTNASVGTDPFVVQLDANGNLDWAHSFATFGEVHGLGTSAAGEVYVTGVFQDSMDLDPGAATELRNSQGAEDRFLIKLDAAGDFLWGNAVGGANPDEVYGLAVDASGAVYTTGVFSGSVDFDSGNGTTVFSNFYRNAYVDKTDANGNFMWAKHIRSALFTTAADVIVEPQGSVFVLGDFYDATDFDPGPDSVMLSGTGFNPDIFLLNLDSDGDFLNVYPIQGSNNEEPRALASGPGPGNIYSVGEFGGTVDFDPGTGTQTLSGGGVFIQRMAAPPASVGEQSGESRLRVYPNPTTGGIFIEAESALSGSIDLMDQTGRILFSAHAEGQQMYVNLESYAPGVYFIAVGDGAGHSVHKIIRH